MRVVWIAAGAAVALALGYALLVSPAFEPYWDDQVAYLRLAHGFVARSEFTRADAGAPFVPEPLWPPGYPLFLAPLCLAGCSHWLVAAVQALLSGALVLLAHAVAREVVGARAARVVAVLVALYLPIAYWAAIAYADFFAAFLLVAALAAFLRARAAGSLGWAVAAGALAGWLALARPVFLPFPMALLLLALVVDGRRLFGRARLLPLAALIAAFALVVAPLFVYAQRSFGRPFLSSSGAEVWLGAIQGQDGATLDPFEVEELAAVKAEVALFDRITDRVAQAYAWVELDASLREHGLRWIGHDVGGYVGRTATRELVLWAGDVPIPVAAARSLGPEGRVAFGSAGVVIMLFGVAGAVALARRRTDAALLPLVVILYLGIALAPLGTQPRYTLGAKPLVLTAGVAAVAALAARRRAPRYSPTNF